MRESRTAVVAVVAVALWLAGPSGTPPRLSAQGVKCFTHPGAAPTLADDIAVATVVVYGYFTNPRPQSADLVVVEVVKGQRLLRGKMTLAIPRQVPVPDPNKPQHFLVFVDIYKGTFDPYRGVEATPAALGYVQGLMQIGREDRPTLLRFCFDYLEHSDAEVAKDAFRVIAEAPPEDLRRLAARLPAERLRSWLRNAKTPLSRVGLYAFLLGHCGNPQDADLLVPLFQARAGQESAALTHVMCGYILLDPTAGARKVRDLLKHPSQEFLPRYAALEVVRFLQRERPDVLDEAARLGFLELALENPDLADFVVEDLRRWRAWSLTDRVLALAARESHQLPEIHRAVLRYALHCPRPEAARLVAAWRQRDQGFVETVEDRLKQEEEYAP